MGGFDLAGESAEPGLDFGGEKSKTCRDLDEELAVTGLDLGELGGELILSNCSSSFLASACFLSACCSRLRVEISVIGRDLDGDSAVVGLELDGVVVGVLF